MEEAVKVRKGVRVWLWRTGNSLMTLLDGETKRTSDQDAQVMALAEEFGKQVSKLEVAQENVQFLIDEKLLENDINEADHYKLKAVYPVQAKISQFLKAFASQDCASSSAGSVEAKLPKLELPCFSGDVREWTSFWEQFQAVIENSDLPGVSKFSYLRMYLRGEALTAIAGLSLTTEDYEAACEILVERFGRTEKLIFSHIQELLALEAPGSPSVRELWDFYNSIKSHVRSLETLKIDGTKYGVILTPLILSRLTPELRMEWARNGEKHESDLDHLMTFLKTEIERRERSQVFESPDNKPTAAALHVGTTAATTTKKDNCRICGKGPHAIQNCRTLLALPADERQKRLKAKRICFRCLTQSTPKKSHNFSRCSAKCSVCGGRHHQIVCIPFSDRHANEHTNSQSHNTDSFSESRVCTSSSHDMHENVLLQTIKVSVGGRAGKRDAVILFDTGADRSYVSQDLVDQIKPDWVGKKSLAYAAFGSENVTTPTDRDMYNLSLQGEGEPINLKVTSVKAICAPVSQPNVPSEILSKFSNHFVSVPAGEKVRIDILIGLDAYWNIMYRDIKSLSPSLVAQNSRLGWILSGSIPDSKPNHSVVSHQLFCTSVEENFWSLETIGICENERENVAADPVLDQFKERITKSGERYSVSLPWKGNMADQLLSNKKGALKRLENLEVRFKKDTQLREQYYSIFAEMENHGIIEEVTAEVSHSGPTYYMPHHPVVKESSTTTKVRPVFDASAKGYNGISLNDCMEAGPNFLPDLPALLIRFRRWKIGLTADVTKAFLQVGINPEDRDVHRFLLKMEEDKVREMRFTRVPFGNKCSPFLLMATIKHHLTTMPPSHTADEIEENLYMDDLISGCDSEKEGKQMFSEAQEIMGNAGMKLAKWGSNSEELCQKFENKTFVTDTLKVLGMQWQPDEDVFSFEGCAVPPDLCLTKRLVLSMIARLFDPLGFLNPFVIRAKCLFQVLWREEVDWDQTIEGELKDLFLSWLMDLSILKAWKIPRRYFSGLWTDNPCIVLHGFGDASQKAYGACVYVLIKRPDGQIDSSLVMSRARVAPIKEVTLPRLELLAALLCARLVTYVKQSLKLSPLQEVHCWTDSTVTLAWLQKEPEKWKTFVANRVAEVQGLVAAKHWHHCPGILNPADLLTRGISAKDLSDSETWLKGPTDLMSNIDDEKVCHDFDTEEEAKTPKKTSTSCVTTEQKVRKPVIEIERYNFLIKAMRVMAYVQRFIQNLKVRQEERQVGDLSFHELDRARFLLLEEAQIHHFNKELKALRNGQSVPRDSPIQKLSPFLGEDGLLRVQSRLQFAGLSGSTAYPVIVPKGHFAILLARRAHIAKGHAGVNSMLIQLRDNYWVIGARRACKTVKAQCTACQRVDSPPCSQYMSPLPEERVQQSSPFSVTGLDHAGPLFCASDPGKKLYILLFTCAVTRAVHLELVDSLSSEDTLLALRRFFARRGMSSILWSDNAKGFLAARAALLEKHGSHGPDWRLIAPRAPWWGGWWERLVGSVKTSLRKALGRRRLGRQELETLLHEIECCVNARPLTFVGDTLDSGQTLTPSHFLLGRSSPYTKVEVDPNISISNPADLFEQHEGLLKEFWYVWKQEYLRNLPPFKGKGPGREIEKGSVVLIENEGARITWPLGIVEKMIQGRDGLARTVEIRTEKGTFVRPIQRLHSLEILNSPAPIGTETQRQSDTLDTSKPTSGTDRSQSKDSERQRDSAKGSGKQMNTSPDLVQQTRSGRSVRARNILDL